MRLDIEHQELVTGDVRVHLTRGQCSIMAALAPGKPVPMDKLIRATQRDTEKDWAEAVVRVMVWQMRRKFLAAGLGKIIRNIWGEGYEVEQPIEVVRRGPEPITIPAEHRRELERLLLSHPDHTAAGRIMSAVS